MHSWYIPYSSPSVRSSQVHMIVKYSCCYPCGGLYTSFSLTHEHQGTYFKSRRASGELCVWTTALLTYNQSNIQWGHVVLKCQRDSFAFLGPNYVYLTAKNKDATTRSMSDNVKSTQPIGEVTLYKYRLLRMTSRLV
jgi:hypothetical protein